MVRNEIYVEKFFLIWKNCDKNFLGFLFCWFAFLFHFSSLAMIFWVFLISLKGLHYCYSYLRIYLCGFLFGNCMRDVMIGKPIS